MLASYFPVLLFLAIGAAVGVGAVVTSGVLARLSGVQNPDSEKLSPYECGFEAFEDARMKFDVRYYLIAILFILFDLETALLFPWAATAKELGPVVFGTIFIFILELVLGLVYLWKKGALEWE